MGKIPHSINSAKNRHFCNIYPQICYVYKKTLNFTEISVKFTEILCSHSLLQLICLEGVFYSNKRFI